MSQVDSILSSIESMFVHLASIISNNQSVDHSTAQRKAAQLVSDHLRKAHGVKLITENDLLALNQLVQKQPEPTRIVFENVIKILREDTQ